MLHNLQNSLRTISRNPIGLLGLIGLVFFILMSFVGPYIFPFNDDPRMDQIYQAPSWQHLMGTDHLGRDNAVQIVHGGREVMIVAFSAGLISLVIATLVGGLSAFLGGRFDTIAMTLADVVLTVPRIIVLTMIAGLIKFTDPLALAPLIGMLTWPTLARGIRAQILSLRERDYVEASRVLGMGTAHIVFVEMLPNMMGYILTGLILAMTTAIYEQIVLIFLGLVPLSGANWGLMLNFAYNRGAIFQKDSVYYILAPTLAIVLFQLTMVSFARALEEIFNPRLRTQA